jgi:hypothetical protein
LAAYGAHWFAGLGSRGSFGVWRHVVSEAQIGATVTDAELTKYLNITPEQAAIILPKLTTAKRALYDRMAQVAIEAALWTQGLGPKPAGVLIDTERGTRRRRAWR